MDMRANHELYSLLAHYNADYEHILKRITIRGPISVYDFTLIKALCAYLKKDVKDFIVI